MRKNHIMLALVIAIQLGILSVGCNNTAPVKPAPVESVIIQKTASTCLDNACSIGDTLVFGTWDNKPIQWRIIDKDIYNHRYMLLAMDVLGKRPYHTTYSSVTWEDSTIRSWLNGYNPYNNSAGVDYRSDNFISRAFTSKERSQIPKVKVVNDNNTQYGSVGGRDTEDYVFLLSINEVNALLPLQYNMCSKINCELCWWLRSPGYNASAAAYVLPRGTIEPNGNEVNKDLLGGVRPALWLNY